MITPPANLPQPSIMQPSALVRPAENRGVHPKKHHVIVDSNMTREQALAQNPAFPAPQEIIGQQRLLDVRYYSFDNKLHRGQIVVDDDVARDVRDFFKLARHLHFPIAKVIPAADPRYHWSDPLMMADNNTSGYNYRAIAGSTTLSHHARGRAIDVNTFLNPYIYVDNDGSIVTDPEGATYDPAKPGTLTANHPLVRFLKQRGWTWGGDWTLAADEVIDYQHFEKP